MNQINKEPIELIINKYHLTDYQWIDPKEIVVSKWVRMKCIFGCNGYGGASCPPHVPSIEDCRAFFYEYDIAVMFRFNNRLGDPSEHKKWARHVNRALLDIERDIFLTGQPKVFMTLISTCNFCEDCVNDRARCKSPLRSRPTPEALSVDVFATVRKYGFPIQVLRDYSEEMNRYSLLMIE